MPKRSTSIPTGPPYATWRDGYKIDIWSESISDFHLFRISSTQDTITARRK